MRWLLVLAGLLLAGISPAHAITANTFEYFSFKGTCQDCASYGTATLELENYTLGDTIQYGGGTTDEFVQFSYSGTNLAPAFTITGPQVYNYGSYDVGGAIGGSAGALPGPESFYVDTQNSGGIYFESDSSGIWCVNTSTNNGCFRFEADYGFVNVWNGVPEPASLAVFGSGLLASVLLRRRRRV